MKCRACGRSRFRVRTSDNWDVLSIFADGLCYRMPRPEDGCGWKFQQWMSPEVAAQVNGTSLTAPERAVAIDQWLSVREPYRALTYKACSVKGCHAVGDFELPFCPTHAAC